MLSKKKKDWFSVGLIVGLIVDLIVGLIVDLIVEDRGKKESV